MIVDVMVNAAHLAMLFLVTLESWSPQGVVLHLEICLQRYGRSSPKIARWDLVTRCFLC